MADDKTFRMAPAPEARCPAHPDSAVVATCHRCGRFVCAADAHALLRGTYCDGCADRPEVNILDGFHRAHFGERDGWAKLLGVTGALALAATAFLATGGWTGAAPPALLALTVALAGYGALGVAYFFRVRAARWGLVALLSLCAPLAVGVAGPWALVLLALPGLFVGGAFTSVSSRLFFRLEVPVEALERDWRRRYDNPAARDAVSWAVLGLLLPLALPVALVVAVIALLRVDPTAQPPIGGKTRALFALILSLVALAAWALVFTTGLRPW
ncbi:MAG: hypothetical protein INH41_14515 [Myxococcaceae bacterium]|jgi:hypothetical protein|nr:hypothetical protein [Myxococcaceae bacterium]